MDPEPRLPMESTPDAVVRTRLRCQRRQSIPEGANTAGFRDAVRNVAQLRDGGLEKFHQLRGERGEVAALLDQTVAQGSE